MDAFTKRFNNLLSLLNKRSMSEIARETGFTATSINNIARGQTKPRFEVLQSLAINYPQLNIRWLLTGENEPLLEEVYNISDEDLEKTIEEVLEDISRIKKRLSDLESNH